MLTLFRWLMLRRLARERGGTLLTVSGVALGVAVFVAIRLASGSALASFADTVDAVAGRANLQVQSRSDGFDERLYLRIRQVPGVQAAAPVVQVSALARAGGPRPAVVDTMVGGGASGYGETLLMLGLDPLVESPFLRLDARSAGQADPAAAANAIQLLARPNTIAITRAHINMPELGAAIALNLLFHIPLTWGVCLTSLDVLAVLFLQHHGFRYVEALVVGLILTIAGSFAIELWFARPDLGAVATGFVPRAEVLTNPRMLYIAIGILGATVMPHNLYLHSSVVQTRAYERTDEGKARAVRFSTLDALCRELGCQPGDLLAFEPGPPEDPPDFDDDEEE